METYIQHDQIIFFMPLEIKKREGRKMVIIPEDTALNEAQIDNTLLKALVKAQLWHEQLQSGQYSSIADLSQRQSLARSYVSSILKLNFLSPHIKEAIIEGTQPKELNLSDFMNDIPLLWSEQAEKFGFK